MGKAILVVSFGTTYPETRRKTIEACEEAIMTSFPDYKVCRAFTSNVVRRRIKEQEGLDIPTVRQALEHLLDQGVREVFIQPLHLILGGEYEKVLTQAETFKASFKRLLIGKPLLHSETDYSKVRALLLGKYGHFAPDTATVLMGHGSQHHTFTAYAALDHMLQDSAVYVGCVESYPPVDLIEKELRSAHVKEVHLAPLMLVAGDHATKDMTSEEADSWCTFFKQHGYRVKTHLIGLGEYPEIQELYVQHLKEIIND